MIRESVPQDLRGIARLYPAAFPDEDLLPVVKSLLQESAVALSLVALVDAEAVGHVAFTHCHVEGSSARLALLAPLAVAPTFQRQGIGAALVRAGFQQLEGSGVNMVFVLGDPRYYSRHGFKTESMVETPLPIPDEWREAWQSVELAQGGAPVSGRLIVPQQWMKPELWS